MFTLNLMTVNLKIQIGHHLLGEGRRGAEEGPTKRVNCGLNCCKAEHNLNDAVLLFRLNGRRSR